MGQVTDIELVGSSLMARAPIKPAVDFDRLEQVFVMLRRGPTMELLYGTAEGDATVAASGLP